MAVQAIDRYNVDLYFKETLKPCVVKFWHNQCPMCLELASIYEKLSEVYGDRFDFFEVNTMDKNAFGIPKAFDIEGVPEIYFFQNGKHREIPWPGNPAVSGYSEEYLIEHFDNFKDEGSE
tara:strand:- start:503 stop:862 length:360 start_codon:yes stop_codon:yes gene_type:complete